MIAVHGINHYCLRFAAISGASSLTQAHGIGCCLEQRREAGNPVHINLIPSP